MIIVTLFCRAGVAECEQVAADLKSLESQYPHQLVVMDIHADPSMATLFSGKVPVVDVGPYRLKAPITRQDLLIALGAAQDRAGHLEAVGDERFKQRLQRGRTYSRTDQATYWFTSHYMTVFNLIFLLYVGLPFMAPVFMKIGLQAPARIIYAVYSPLCHQLAFRSWFLFGEQPAYPRDLAGVPGLISFKQATGIDATDILASRAFIGNAQLGYKVALCERDVAIYGSIFLFGLVFSLTGRKLKSLPWYLLVLVGIIPIGIDGFSQLPSLMTGPLVALLPMRESTPFLRTLTGFLFGVSIAWYGFPFVEESIQETRRLLVHKIAIASQTERK
jgi:uncharacterized membrane protein